MYGIWAYLSSFSRIWAFLWKLGSGSGSWSASRWKVGSGSGSASNKNQHPDTHQSDADPQHCCELKQSPTLFPGWWYESWLTCCVKSGIRWESTAGSNIRRPPPLSPSTILMVKHPESVYSSSFTFFSLLGCCPEDSPLGELPPPPSHQTGSSQQRTYVIKRLAALLDFKEIFSRYFVCVSLLLLMRTVAEDTNIREK